MCWELAKAFIFKLDAERAHELSLKTVAGLGSLSPRILEAMSGASFAPPRRTYGHFGKNLSTPVGLAAGFDKNGVILPYLPSLGFGFAEIGSVTLRSQPGNTKPRLFRGDESLFNFMGFNNDGAEVIARRLQSYSLPADFGVGINIGLGKLTPHDQAAEEYRATYSILREHGDYFVVNVSSPNTPGLRALQELKRVGAIFSCIRKIPSTKPIYLKLAPELSDAALEEFLLRADELGIDGFVLTNTLGGERAGMSGGWSGAQVREVSRERLKFARSRTRRPIVSVGGITDVSEALERKKLGADLIQIYTGWIFRGPTFPTELGRAWSYT